MSVVAFEFPVFVSIFLWCLAAPLVVGAVVVDVAVAVVVLSVVVVVDVDVVVVVLGFVRAAPWLSSAGGCSDFCSALPQEGLVVASTI